MYGGSHNTGGPVFTTTGGIGTTSTAYYSSNVTNTSGTLSNTFAGPNIRSKKSIETGRVEKGDKSKQSFTNSYQEFNYNVEHQITFKILPLGTKNKTTEDIRQYCTECGTKTKTNFKFCPSCGNKL
jgi:rRNA maturation endonuclease Nob1